ncbi:transcriptional activator Myb-like, partial [Salvelinus sp. IW2-2015]|uniref:transcriptional activator Myb-like n=1 Tax=Salvelinus sp. IW2-2015 TaxID=2691554 RepID=UPI0038D46849
IIPLLQTGVVPFSRADVITTRAPCLSIESTSHSGCNNKTTQATTNSHHDSHALPLPEFMESVIDSLFNQSDSHSLPMSSQKPLVAPPRQQKENGMFRTPTICRSLLELSPRTLTPFRSVHGRGYKTEPMECVGLVGGPTANAVFDRVRTGLTVLRTVVLTRFRTGFDRVPTRCLDRSDEVLTVFRPDLLTSSVLNQDGHKPYHLPRRSLGSPLQQLNTWDQVACGKVEDQVLALEQNHKYITTHSARTLVM